MTQLYKFTDDNGVTRLEARQVPDPVPAAGSLVPVADATGVTVDNTTYDDTIKGSGKLTTLVFPADAGALAIALAGDAFPRWVLGADPNNFGLCAGVGTADPTQSAAVLAVNAASEWVVTSLFIGGPVSDPLMAPPLNAISPKLTITSGALPTVDFTGKSGMGQQVSTARDVDIYVETGTAGSVVAALSPDNMTYTTIYTKTMLATDVCHARVPAGWYLKLTATTAVLGVGTYA